MSKAKTDFSRPVNKVYVLELVEENEKIRKENKQRDRQRRQTDLLSGNN